MTGESKTTMPKTAKGEGPKVISAIFVFPFVTLNKYYKLRYGEVGASVDLAPNYPTLAKLFPSVISFVFGEAPTENPVFAISANHPEWFVIELEHLKFMFESRLYPASGEVFGNSTKFVIEENADEKSLWIGSHLKVQLSKDASLSINIQRSAKPLIRWDEESLANFESVLSDILSDSFYHSLLRCIENADDKEISKERARINIAITLFNQCYIGPNDEPPTTPVRIMLLAAAFEALLNLPSDSIVSSFEYAITTLLGGKTARLKKWCRDFYSLRSGLVHGDIIWRERDESQQLLGFPKAGDVWIARQLFIYLLKVKLYLLGIYPDFRRGELDLEGLFSKQS